MEILWLIVALLVMLVGLAGTIIPGVPGLPLVLIGQLVYAWATGFRTVGWNFLLFMLLLMAFGMALDYATGPLLAKRAGASPLGMLGAVIGGIGGALTLGPIGLLVGPLAGAVLGELIYGQSFQRAGEVGWRTFLGVWLGVLLQIVVALAMILLFILKVF